MPKTLTSILLTTGLIAATNVAVAAKRGVATKKGVATQKEMMQGQLCVESMCGPADKADRLLAPTFHRQAELMMLKGPIYPDDVQAVVDDIVRIESEERDLLERQISKIDVNSNRELTGVARSLYNLAFYMRHKNRLIGKVSAAGKLEIDEEVSKETLKDLSPQDRSWMIQAAKWLAEGPVYISEKDLAKLRPIEILIQIYPGLSFEDGLEKLKKENAALFAEAKRKQSLEKAMYFSASSEDRIANLLQKPIRDLSETELRDLIRWQNNAITMARMMKGSLLTERRTPTVKVAIAEMGGLDKLRERFRNPTSKDLTTTEKMKDCETTYFMNAGLLPMKPDIEQLKKDIVETKESLKALIKAKFPESTWSQLLSEVDKTSFMLPPTRDEFHREFKIRLEGMRKGLKAGMQVTKSSPRVLEDILVAMGNIPPSSEPPSETPINTICDGFRYKPVSDGNYTVTGTILLSYATPGADATYRQFLLTHEIGHSLFERIQTDPVLNKMFEPVRKCLANTHMESPPSGTDTKWKITNLWRKRNPEKADLAAGTAEEGPYVNEDFSDALGQEMRNNEKKGTVDKGNPICRFTMPSYGGYTEQSLQSNDLDSHSSVFSRILSADIAKNGKMTDACRDYFKPHNIEGRFQSCLSLVKPLEPSEAGAGASSSPSKSGATKH